MDPLSMAAGIIAITTLARGVVGYLNDVKDASKEQARIAAEISTADALLTPLQHRIKSTQSGDPWFTEVQRLGVEGGPLEQFKSTLMRLKSEVEQRDRYKKAVRLMGWTFGKTEVSAMLSRIERVKTLVSLALANDTFMLSRKIQEGLSDVCADVSDISGRVTDMQSMLDDQERRALDQERRIIADWLSPLNFRATQSEIFSQRQDGTGQWLLESEKFKDWVDGTKKGLWCPGIPGAGKTILASTVTDYLRTTFEKHDIAVACIYCSYKDQIEQTDLNLIGSLLKQLVQSQSVIPPDIKQLYDAHVNERTPPTHGELKMTLKSEIETFSKVFIIVDALDECPEDRRANLVDMLLSMPETVKLMVTSRPLSTIETGLEEMTRLDIRANDNDVRLYVEGRIPHEKRLARHVRKDPTLGETLVSTIVNSARGMFLLAQLYMDSLVSKNNADAIREALQHPPEKLEDTYEEAMARVLKQSREDRELALGVISWISCAVRPLSIEELQHALAVRLGDTYLRRGALPDEEIMISVCVGIVVVDESSIIKLVHYTAQEYFDRTRESKFPNAQVNIALTCATYLSFDVFEMGPCTNDAEFETRLRDYSLLDYAANHWGHHTRGGAEEICREKALIFLQHNSKILCASQVMHVPEYKFSGYSGLFPKSVSGLHVAAGFGMKATVDSLLGNGVGADPRDSNGRTPLSWSARRGQVEIAKLLVGVEGVDPDLEDNGGRTPLSWGANEGHLEIVKLLVGVEGVDPGSKDNDGRTPLSWATRNGHLEIAKLLVGVEGVGPDPKDDNGWTPLSWGASEGHLEIVKLLVGVEGVDPDSKDIIGRTPLLKAAGGGHLETVKLLVGVEGVNPDSKDRRRQTPLSEAARRGHLEIVKLLVGVGGVDRDSRDNNGRTPLSRAAGASYLHIVEEGHLDIVKLPVRAEGVDPDSRDVFGRTPLSWAARRGYIETVKLLVGIEGVDPDSKDPNGRTPLSEAARGGHLEIVKLLAGVGGVDPNSKDLNGRTPLSWAVGEGQLEVAKLLVGVEGVDLNPKDKHGRTPPSYAAQNGHLNIIKMLVEVKGTDLNSKDKYSQTPLSYAAWKGHLEIVKVLVGVEGVDQDSREPNGRTPLSWAAENGHLEIFKLPIGIEGVNRDSRDNHDRTPLSWAAEEGHLEIVKLLVETEGVDPTFRDLDGRTPFSWAAKKGLCNRTANAELQGYKEEVVEPDDKTANAELAEYEKQEKQRRHQQSQCHGWVAEGSRSRLRSGPMTTSLTRRSEATPATHMYGMEYAYYAGTHCGLLAQLET